MRAGMASTAGDGNGSLRNGKLRPLHQSKHTTFLDHVVVSKLRLHADNFLVEMFHSVSINDSRF